MYIEIYVTKQAQVSHYGFYFRKCLSPAMGTYMYIVYETSCMTNYITSSIPPSAI